MLDCLIMIMAPVLRPLTIALVLGAMLETPLVADAQTLAELDLGALVGARLLVIAPHPDDETLGAGGLIQRVRANGGSVRVIVVTSGDALSQGVELTDRTTSPTPNDFRRYGRLRETESAKAVAELGLSPEHITFLGFPDDGLCRLASRYLSARSRRFESPYTHRVEPPLTERFMSGVAYRGVDVRREFERILLTFRPTIVAVPDARDEHPDHCSTHIFAEEAIARVSRGSRGVTPRLLFYLVHYQQWRLGPADDRVAALLPPATFPDAARFRTLKLTGAEATRKRQALLAYTTQTRLMRPFMIAFAGQNELFLEGEPAMPPPCWCDGAPVAIETLPTTKPAPPSPARQ
jgi:LmbE family N-acetylglucosaminyl deacetylase